MTASDDRQPNREATMKIQVNTDSSVEGSDALAVTVEDAVHAALDRYGHRLTRVEVHLSDEDGDVGDHRSGKRCLLEARPSGMDPVVVTGSADTLERACHDATQKMQSLLDSTFGRIDSRDADATIRQHRG
jgi:regulator of PEP synthase PpsR (kinase-PPPase family)